ncbi:segregation and condensation protein B [Mycoplasma testudineum]|uniref:Segregation and condensation protein B n=1 Tax=Mycoplasma testudineum TaxID=244584 RepID=A0A4R6IDJ0_9MOLU|nr:SMC-Scp complex subunit ScpB [Mycoplasma testudineum]OYD26798.1 SMC-Scp complex subunit ScpB [Mycoplasma testudineum]TDO20333.1 segregation and condensation protein B [Mycoplasma testudineum]
MSPNSRILEALAFIQGEEGITIDHVQKVFNFDPEEDKKMNQNEALKLLNDFKKEYNELGLGTKVFEFNKVFKIATSENVKEYVEKLVSFKKNQKLSKASLETIGIIAYKQPVTRSMVNEIRGVSSDAVFQGLLLKGLIEEVGVAQTPGNPILYGVTNKFYDYFKIRSLHDLPRLQEFEFTDVEFDDDEQTFNLFQSQREE